MESNTLLLIVEDDRVDAMIIKRALKESNCPLPIERVENGAKALELLEQSSDNVAIILLDLNMPFMNGFEFLKRKREIDKIKDIPVIVFSTSNNEDDKKLSKELGAKDYYVKPIGYDEYKDILRKIEWAEFIKDKYK